jgi:hypothetical protein
LTLLVLPTLRVVPLVLHVLRVLPLALLIRLVPYVPLILLLLSKRRPRIRMTTMIMQIYFRPSLTLGASIHHKRLRVLPWPHLSLIWSMR